MNLHAPEGGSIVLKLDFKMERLLLIQMYRSADPEQRKFIFELVELASRCVNEDDFQARAKLLCEAQAKLPDKVPAV